VSRDRLEIDRRAADRLQHVALAVCWSSDSRSSPRSRGVFHGDHRLVAKVRKQADLTVRERLHPIAGDSTMTPINVPSRISGTAELGSDLAERRGGRELVVGSAVMSGI
jgi:hypothetical protein